MFVKLGESVNITLDNLEPIENVLCDAEIVDRFSKFAANLKTIAPMAKDFLYFTAVMMHAAEASLVDADGNIKKDAQGNLVTANWENVGNGVKWVCSDPHILPYKNSNCFVAGTKILMSDGTVKNIENIEVGDEVISHTGEKRKVTHTFIRPFDGDLCNINIRNELPLMVTDNHPFYRLTVTHPDNIQDTPKHLLALNKTAKNFEFVNAGDLSKYDLLTCPNIKCDAPNEFTPGQARLLGLFAAEGSFSKKYGKDQGLILTFSIKEKDTLVKYTKELFEKEFSHASVKVNERPDRSVCNLTVTGSGIAEFFRRHVGEYSQYKTLSPQVVFNENPEIRENFVIGWLEGDGHVGKDYGQVVGITTSENLASQIKIMLNSLGIRSSLRLKDNSSTDAKIINEKYGAYNISDVYRIEIASTCASNLIKNSNYLNFENKPKDRNEQNFYENYSLRSIKNIEKLPYSGYLYNFEVEKDHSYIANFIAVHNCDIFPASELIKAHKKWIGRPLCLDHKSASVDSIRGVIVDTYYDHKHKRIIALCALDKVNYPDLARKVATGYAASVSMGVGVGRAVCSDCHKVAKIESDFCEHMRRKSAYGEINLDLSPIELSIVVNGADPKAKIKHIIAKDLSSAADSLQNYVDGKLVTGEISKEELLSIQHDLKALNERLDNLVKSSKDSNDLNYGTTSSTKEMAESSETGSVNQLAPPEPIATWSYNEKINDIKVKVSHIQEDLKKLINIKEESNMSKQEKKGYFQGGGGVNEPTPGTPKYEKEDYQTIRDTQDKQMVGQSPFPNTGPVDGMHPGYDSFGESEEQRKRRLQRLAEPNERSLKRQAALEKAKENLGNTKEGYFQGGGGPNEPTPGKVKYPNDVDYRKIRDNEDKQMVGQPPFPNVGDVDGLHPSPASADVKDEAKRKQMLQRASLKAKFVKASTLDGKLNHGESRWDIYAGPNLIMTATVNDITGGNTSGIVYESIATRDFGLKILSSIKSEGLDKTKSSLIKNAQAVLEGAPGKPADLMPSPADMPGDEPLGGGASEDQVQELVEQIKDTADETARRADDLAEAVKSMEGETTELEEVPAAEENSFIEGKTASVESLQSMRKTLNSMLTDAMKEAIASLQSHSEELQLSADIYAKPNDNLSEENKKYLNSLVASALSDAKSTIEDSKKLQAAYAKYAQGTNDLLKRAVSEGKIKKSADDLVKEKDYEGKDVDLKHNKKAENPMEHGKMSTDVKPGEVSGKSKEMNDADGPLTQYINEKKLENKFMEGREPPVYEFKEPDYIEGHAPKAPAAVAKPKPLPEGSEYDPLRGIDGEFIEGIEGANADDALTVVLPGGAEAAVQPGTDMSKLPSGTTSKSAANEPDLTTKEGRAEYRAKLAQKSVQYSDMIGRAHPKGGKAVTLDTKPSADLGNVENVIEQQEKDLKTMNVAPKVRKMAEKIQKLVVAGKLDVSEVDGLIAEGVDPEAVKYWKALWGEAGDSESKEFANKLTQEMAKQKVAKEISTEKVRVKRAYELAYQMADTGIIERSQVSKQVEEILSWNDEAFEGTKRIISKQAIKKQAMPNVGLLNSGEVILPSAEGSVSEDLTAEYSQLFDNRKLFSF